jgi:ABC-type multidrug transport system ATPase subunit/pSer/pThr/pTyr-binding forkhead associated (FHA) protein
MNENNIPPDPISIRFLRGPLAGQTFPVRHPSVTIGRASTNDIVVKADPKVSRTHARLLWQQGSWSIEKLAPDSNTLTVNQQPVQQATISTNTTIGLGPDTSFLVEPAPAVAPLPLTNTSAASASHPSPPKPQQQTMGAFLRPSEGPNQTQVAQDLPSLVVSSNIHGTRQSYPLTNDVINIGRASSNDISIKEGAIVSAHHLQIIRQHGQFILLHPHPDQPRTLNGLLYQGRQIPGDESFRKTLTNGDIFRIGDENGTLVTLTYYDGTGIAPQELVPPVQPFDLDKAEITIGRSPNNTVVLPHPQVSAHHALMRQEGGTYRIIDLKSTNHTYVESEMTSNALLKLGDEIRIGPYRLVFELNKLIEYDETNFIRIDALDLQKTVNEGVTLLNHISLSIPPRTFVALVGGSGAGKSTLMDALNGLRPASQGQVLYNGQDYYRNLAAFSTQFGYVPQEDIVHRDLTVERALYYAAKMRLPSDFTDAQIEQRINEVLEEVEIAERRKLLVSKLSGGQRKRLSIALELLANPSLFFLDEPTSGLDPGLDRKMMFLLRKLADKGHTIILVTHATNNINTCDYVCFLVKDGRMAYFGPPEEAKRYFQKTDFAEIYTSLEPTDENPSIPAEAEARFKSSPDYQKYVVEPLQGAKGGMSSRNGQQPAKPLKASKRSNPLRQFLLLTLRYVELLKNDKPTLAFLLLQAPLIGVLILLIARFELGFGPNLFSANNVVQCSPTILAASAIHRPENPTGILGLNTNGNNGPVDCHRIVTFLQTDPEGQRYVRIQRQGDVNKALQDYILVGSGSGARTLLFILAYATLIFGIINSYREIVKEAAIYRRERTVNLGILPYMGSKLVVLGLLGIMQSLMLLLITDVLEPLHQGVFLPVHLEVLISLVLSSLVGVAVGLAISAAASNTDIATSFTPFVILPQLIFAGTAFPLRDWPLQIFAMTIPTRWTIIAINSSIGIHSEVLDKDSLLGSDPSFHGTLFSTFSQSEATQRILLAWAALGAILLLLLLTIGIALKAKDVRK